MRGWDDQSTGDIPHVTRIDREDVPTNKKRRVLSGSPSRPQSNSPPARVEVYRPNYTRRSRREVPAQFHHALRSRRYETVGPKSMRPIAGYDGMRQRTGRLHREQSPVSGNSGRSLYQGTYNSLSPRRRNTNESKQSSSDIEDFHRAANEDCAFSPPARKVGTLDPHDQSGLKRHHGLSKATEDKYRAVLSGHHTADDPRDLPCDRSSCNIGTTQIDGNHKSKGPRFLSERPREPPLLCNKQRRGYPGEYLRRTSGRGEQCYERRIPPIREKGSVRYTTQQENDSLVEPLKQPAQFNRNDLNRCQTPALDELEGMCREDKLEGTKSDVLLSEPVRVSAIAEECPPHDERASDSKLSNRFSERRTPLAERLLFPEIGMKAPISVNVKMKLAQCVGRIMVDFEDKCLQLLMIRGGLQVEDLQKRIPQLRAMHYCKKLRPDFLKIGVNELQSLSQYAKRLLRIDDETEVDAGYYSETPRADRECGGVQEKRIQLYPKHLVEHYLNESKVVEGHPARYESLNKRFDFITRSLLWCLRPPKVFVNSNGFPKRVSTANAVDPEVRSVELNADVMNVWMILVQEWCDTLRQLQIDLVEDEEGADSRPIEVVVESDAEHIQSMFRDYAPMGPPKVLRRTLFLTTDYMTLLEQSLLPKTSLFDPRIPFEQVAKIVEPKDGFEFACKRLFRFFARRHINPWDYELVCWPINYMGAHWIILTVDTTAKEMVWSDSYYSWYLDACRERNIPLDASCEERKSVSDETGRLKVQRMNENSSDAVSTEREKRLSFLRWPGWMYFQCVEEYLRWDLKHRISLKAEAACKSKEHLLGEEPWRRVIVENLPQQQKLSLDCGVYAAHFARCVGQFSTTTMIDFDTQLIPDFRRIMAVVVGRGCIPQNLQDLIDDAERCKGTCDKDEVTC